MSKLLLPAIAFILISLNLKAEPGCEGSIYREPTCEGECSDEHCQDISFGQDGSEFQCCEPTAPWKSEKEFTPLKKSK